ncbi:hypothetical protein FNF29_00182 [Cafeteria roenbergensis]|nr:hypothetical protein FNF29_00182 [Cafeteria roenbergensis]|eukprot:KAA0157606.1 hypothetical protein FNF29_00182 [Cafeteria roenbergensis]
MRASPATMAAALMYQATRGADADVRQCAAALFRRFFTAESSETPLWFTEEGFGNSVRGALKEALLQATAVETEDAVARMLATIVGDIGMMELEHHRWPELMPTVFRWLTAGEATPISRMAGLRALEYLTVFICSFMQKDYPTFARIIAAVLSSSTDPLPVRIQAARALCSILAWEEEGCPGLSAFASMAQILVHFTGHVVASGQSAAADELLRLLCDVASEQAPFFKPVLGEAVSGMLTIADTASVPDKIRRLALEFVVLFAESAPGLARKLPDNRFVTQLLPVILQAMVRVDPAADPDWDERETVEESDPETTASIAASHVERVVSCIGPRRTLPVLYPMLSAASAHADWRYRLAAMQGLASAAAGHPPTTDAEELRGMVGRICKCVGDSEPRVRVAAALAITTWCHHHAPTIQLKTSDSLLPAIGALLNDPHPRVQAQACEALNEYVVLDFPGRIAPHAAGIVEQVTNLLASGTRTVREYCLLCLTALAQSAKEGMVTIYPTLLPFLRTLAEDPMPAFAAAARGKPLPASLDPRRVRGLACDALSNLAAAVGPSVCAKDLPAILATLGKAAAEATGPDDSLRASAWEALALMAQEFPDGASSVIPVLVPALMHAGGQTLDAREVSQEEAQAYRERQDAEAAEGASAEAEFHLYDDDRATYGLMVRVASMEDRSMAFQLLTRLTHASASSGALAPYVPDALRVVAAALADSRMPCAQVRSNAAELASDLVLSAAVAAARAGCSPEAIVATTRTPVVKLLSVLLPALLERGLDPNIRVALAAAVRFCIFEGGLDRATDGRARAAVAQGETATPGAWAPSHLSAPSGHLHHTYTFIPFLPDETLAAVVSTAVQAVRASRQRVATSRADVRTRADEFDEEALQDQEQEIATEEDAQSQLIDLISVVARSHLARGIAAIEAKAGKFLADDLLAPGASFEARKLAVFVMDDVLEFGGPEGIARLPSYVPVLLEGVAAAGDSVNLAQAAAYGLGAAAQAAGPAFAPYADASLSALWTLVRAVRPEAAPQAKAGKLLAKMGVPGVAVASTPAGMESTFPGSPQALVDNALTAIAKILHFCKSPLPDAAAAGAGAAAAAAAAAPSAESAAMLTEWSRRLPICSDLIEARTATAILCERLASGCPAVVGTTPAATARALTVVSWSLQTSNVCTPFLLRAAAAACSGLSQRLGDSAFASVWAAVPECMRGPLKGAASAAEKLAPSLPTPAPPSRTEPLSLG